MKKTNIFLTIFFVSFLAIPIFDNIFQISPIKNLFEKRLPAELPQNPENLAEFKNYPKKFENFFNDNYGFRKTLITLNSWILDNVFNQSPSERGLIGKDEWLYFDNNNSILDAQGLLKIDEKKFENAADIFIKNWQKLKAQNIDYALIIAADKTSIYPEFLPDYIKTSTQNHRIDKFLKILKQKNSDFPVLDLRKILLIAKKNEIIYHKTDTHWNRRGAHYGYVEIMKKFGLKYNSRADFEDVEGGYYVGDISHIMNIEAKNIDYNLRFKKPILFSQINLSEEIRKKFHKPDFFKNQDQSLPILLVYKDSFFDNMLYFFAQNFSKSYFINEFPCDLDLNVIKSYKPNFVIQQFWEGRIEEVVNNCKIK